MMQPRSKSAIWANDDSIPEAAKVAGRRSKGKSAPAKSVKTSDTDEEDDAEFQDLTETGAAGDICGSKTSQAGPQGKAAGRFPEMTKLE